MRRPLFIFRSLQAQVTAIFLVISIAPLTLAGWLSLRTGQRLIMGQALNQLENVASDKASLLERWLGERRADLEVLASSPALRSGDRDLIVEHLAAVRRHYLVYQGFTLVGPEGSVVLTEGKSELFPEGVAVALAGRLHQSEIMLGPDGRESVYRLSLPVRSAAGEVVGAVQATVGTGAILSMVLKVRLGETGESYLVDRSGTFLAHQDPKRILRENISQSGSFQNLPGLGPKEPANLYTDYRGIEVLGVSRSIPGTDWYLVVEQDRDEAFAPVDRLRLIFYLLLGGFSLAAVGLSAVFARYFAGPIRRLSEAALALESGHYDTPLQPIARGDEIGTLYREFGRMAAELDARQRKLEARVDVQDKELKVADARLRETQEAAERSQRMAALGRLAAGVTHEIRTPLTSLKLFLQSAREDLQISPELEQDYNLAMGQIARIEGTINRFLNFARPESPIFELIDVGQLIEDTLMVTGPRARHQETDIEVALDPRLPRLRGDRKQLGEVLVNLMTNALEAMKKGDALRVRAAFDRSGAAPRVRIDVRDSGEGIAPENLEKLFDPFFTTKASGTGLGLSIVAGTLARHGGEIRVESEPGRGSTFSVFLPAADEGSA